MGFWLRYTRSWISQLISTAKAAAPGCHCCAAVEEPPSVGCKEDGVKAQRQGLGNWRRWLRPLGCLQHRLQMSASYHLTDALSWLQSISYCTSLYITALRGQTSLGCCFLSSFSSLFLQTPPFSRVTRAQTKQKPNRTQSAIHH